MAAGMPAEEAAIEERKGFGKLQSIREDCREASGASFGEALVQDARYGCRMLRRSPGFTAVAVATLSLGIGANTAIFSLVNAVLFRPLPFREPQRLVWITDPVPAQEGFSGMHRQATLRDWRELNTTCEELGGYLGYSGRMNYILLGNGDPQRLQAMAVTGNFLQVLGIRLQHGRNFIEAECQRNAPG